jgi:hypothetical protein
VHQWQSPFGWMGCGEPMPECLSPAGTMPA